MPLTVLLPIQESHPHTNEEMLPKAEMSIMCRHLPDNRSGSLADFVRLAELLEDLMREVCFTGNFMSDIWSGTNEKLPDLPMFCLVCLVGPALNNNTAKNCTPTPPSDFPPFY